LQSTALGGKVIAEIMADGLEASGYVYAGNEVIAEQVGGYAPVVWIHRNPITESYKRSDQNQWTPGLVNFDPQGIDAGSSPPQPSGAVLIDPDEKGLWTLATMFPGDRHCYLDGIEMPSCASMGEMLASGAFELDKRMMPSSPVIGAGQFEWVEEWEDYDDGKRPHQNPDGTWTVPAIPYRSVGQFIFVPSGGSAGQNGERDPTKIPNRKLNEQEVRKLGEGVKDIISKEDCDTFIKELMAIANRLGPDQLTSRNIMFLFANVRDGRGFYVAPGATYSTVLGNPLRGQGSVYIAAADQPPSFDAHRFSSRQAYNDAVESTSRLYHQGMAVIAIHELFHEAGFGDRVFCKCCVWKISGGDSVSLFL